MYLFINNLYQDKIYLAFIMIIAGKTCKVVASANLSKKHNHSENILKGLDRMLSRSNRKVKDIHGIIVVNGPGSFAGIRVALSITNTFAWLLKIPVVGVSLVPRSPDLRLQEVSQGFIFDNEILIKKGLNKLLSAKKQKTVRPFYGKEPSISKPKSSFSRC